uniref:Uncharacterized protein n=1 Tax=Rhizophora mucronata TaxID=61149 RepID=A0A2P2N788_RHIMU
MEIEVSENYLCIEKSQKIKVKIKRECITAEIKQPSSITETAIEDLCTKKRSCL